MNSPITGQTRTTCPDCDSEGPHDIYKHMGQREFVCSNCGMQHTFPEHSKACMTTFLLSGDPKCPACGDSPFRVLD